MIANAAWLEVQKLSLACGVQNPEHGMDFPALSVTEHIARTNGAFWVQGML